MESEMHARNLIESIQQEQSHNGTIGQSPVASIIRNALDLISDQLYDKATHFLLELLQNADDNTYDCAVPTLNFTYRPGTLRIDCNEVGFSEENVRAICAIGRSTKAGKNRSAGFTGEKGIGFKSVFKIADAVWISSRQFQFMFDKNKDLGMILPQWCEFPEPKIPHQTSFFLKLAATDHEAELVRDLLSLDKTILIFLRRLRQINIKVTTVNGCTSSFKYSRSDSTYSDHNMVVLTQDGKDRSYVVMKYAVTHKKSEIKRPGSTESELMMAFPVSRPPVDQIKGTQKVYAFLPIQDYGFKFLLQGDFLLTANREAIDKSSAWNCAIRDAVANAFLSSIAKIIKGPFRYQWPCFVPIGDISPFFHYTQESILGCIAKQAVLESWSGHIVPPERLLHVSKAFCDDNGNPFTLEYQKHAYLSSRYAQNDMEVMRSMGVLPLREHQFITDLQNMIHKAPGTFQSKSSNWHSQLSMALLPLLNKAQLRKRIMHLDLVPLRDGSWVNASKGAIFFSAEGKRLEIPDGIPIQVVNFNAQATSARRNLFYELGARECDTLELFKYIEKVHRKAILEPSSVNTEKLIAHARFLFSASWNGDGSKLWLATTEGLLCRGFQIYIRKDCAQDSPLGRLYASMKTSCQFLHDDYLHASLRDREAWLLWLEKVFQVSELPRVLDSSTSKLSGEFQMLFALGQSRDLLWVIKENWGVYSQWLDVQNGSLEDQLLTNKGSQEAKGILHQELHTQLVQCTNGKFAISKTVLPMVDRALDLNPHIPALDLLEPLDPSWKILARLGVAVQQGAAYYIRCLDALRCTTHDTDTILYIYEKLRDFNVDESDFIRSTFLRVPLICAATDVQGLQVYSWYTITDCLRANICPDTIYPSCAFFFRCLLLDEVSELESAITRLSLLEKSNTLAEISRLFQDTSAALRKKARERIQLPHDLLQKPIFPISRYGPKGEYDYLAPIGEATSWFVADRDHLRHSFHGMLPLLAFTLGDLDKMGDFLQFFNIEWRKLSRLVREETKPRGLVTRHSSYTQFLRDRVEFIQLLVPTAADNREKLLKMLASIEVNTAAEVVQNYRFKVGDTIVDGTPDIGEIAVSHVGTVLRLFMTEECLSFDCPSFELVETLANLCSISRPMERSLLSMVLSEKNLSRLQKTFRKQGLHVSVAKSNEDCLRPEVQAKRYAGASGDIPTIPSPFHRPAQPSKKRAEFAKTDIDRADGISLVSTEALSSMDDICSRDVTASQKTNPTLLPFRTTKSIPQGVTHSFPSTMFPNINDSYLGELLMSELFLAELGSEYKPSIHWTSPFRSRAGYQPLDSTATSASFTFSEPSSSQAVTRFLTAGGHIEPMIRRLHTPVYRFEVAVTYDKGERSFYLHPDALDKIRLYRHKTEDPGPKDVMVLVLVKDIYTDAKYEFHVDPWRLFTADAWTLRGMYPMEVKFNHLDIIEPKKVHPVPSQDGPKVVSSRYPGPLIVGHAAQSHISQSHISKGSEDWNGRRGTGGYPSISSSSSSPSPSSNAICGANTLSRCYSATLRYVTLPAKSIRLLQLLPGELQQPLRGVVFHVPLDTAGFYRALSYVWGTSSQAETLHTPSGLLEITPNLASALRHARQKDVPLMLWVDSVCIDQSNEIEKAAQIRLLPHTFQQAASVLAFVGDAPSHQRAIEALMQIRAKDAVDRWPKDLPAVPASWSARPIPPLADPVWIDIRAFFESPWFRRSWVCQEAVLAASVRFVVPGGWMLDWNDLLSATETVDREYRLALGDASPRILPWEYFLELAQHREWEARQTRWAMINLLESFRYTESTLKRDRFFSLLGFSSDGADPGFEPDYKAPLEIVLRKFADVFIKQGKVLQMLYRAGMGSHPARFPSWIPDWTVLKSPSIYEASLRGTSFCASWISEPRVVHTSGTDELNIGGYRVGIIDQVSNASNVTDQWFQFWSEVDSMMDSSTVKQQWPYKARKEMIWKIPVAGVEFPKTIVDESVDLQLSYTAFRYELYSAQLKRNRGDSKVPNWGNGLNYSTALQENTYGWRFFTTREGYAGLGPPSTLGGDEVFVFNGGGVPFVLRPSDTRAGYFRLLGEAYVHGMMHGEGKTKLRKEHEGFVRLH